MPNWCVNQVDISGDPEVVDALRKFVVGRYPRPDTKDVEDSDRDEVEFCFDSIIPAPRTDRYMSAASSSTFVCGCKTESRITGQHPDGTDKYDYFVGDKMVAGFDGLCPDHGEVSSISDPQNWYQWNVANWGTKWGASEVYTEDKENRIAGHAGYNFDTAWSPAEPVIAVLAAKYPTLDIAHRYCEGGMGYAGEVLYSGGLEVARTEYESIGADLPENSFIKEDDGSHSYLRDYDAVPMSKGEAFCDEHFGGVVGG